MTPFILELLVSLVGLIVVMLGWLINRTTNKLEQIHNDLINLTIDHGQRITRLESISHTHHRRKDEKLEAY